jgi:histidine ammonia-lyase
VPTPRPVTLDGESLTIDDVVAVARHGKRVAVKASAWKGVEASRRVVDRLVAKGEVAYGITTGFG